jgi:hypothetical protein
VNFVSAVLHHAEQREWIIRAPKIPKAELPEPEPEWLNPGEVSIDIEVPLTDHQNPARY